MGKCDITVKLNEAGKEAAAEKRKERSCLVKIRAAKARGNEETPH